MNLIDSSTWLEYLAVSPHTARVTAPIEVVEQLMVPTIVLLEVIRRVMQQRDEDAALQVAAVMHQGQVVALDSGMALSAAHYGVTHKLPLADRIIDATAKQFAATIWTFNASFADLPGVRYFAKHHKLFPANSHCTSLKLRQIQARPPPSPESPCASRSSHPPFSRLHP